MANIISINDFGAFTELQKERYTNELLEISENCAGKKGLLLSRAQCEMLVEKRKNSLKESGRVEMGIGALELLVVSFSASKFIAPCDFASTISDLLEIFYYMKTEFSDEITDRELVNKMFKSFEGECAGSIEMLQNTDRYFRRHNAKTTFEEESDDEEYLSDFDDPYSSSDYDYLRGE